MTVICSHRYGTFGIYRKAQLFIFKIWSLRKNCLQLRSSKDVGSGSFFEKKNPTLWIWRMPIEFVVSLVKFVNRLIGVCSLGWFVSVLNILITGSSQNFLLTQYTPTTPLATLPSRVRSAHAPVARKINRTAGRNCAFTTHALHSRK
jgi:hypothetical protein